MDSNGKTPKALQKTSATASLAEQQEFASEQELDQIGLPKPKQDTWVEPSFFLGYTYGNLATEIVRGEIRAVNKLVDQLLTSVRSSRPPNPNP